MGERQWFPFVTVQKAIGTSVVNKCAKSLFRYFETLGYPAVLHHELTRRDAFGLILDASEHCNLIKFVLNEFWVCIGWVGRDLQVTIVTPKQ